MPLSIAVLGDELESCLFAVAAAKQGANVTLLRRSDACLGGLSTRGGLSYMDITPELLPPLFHHFLKAVGWKRVALNPEKAHETLLTWFDELKIKLLSNVTYWESQTDSLGQLVKLKTNQGDVEADWWVDSTPDAQLARALGVPYLAGLGGLCGAHPRVNSLGVSPVFRVSGLSRERLIEAEKAFREKTETSTLLEQVFPFYSETFREELLKRPIFSPEASDYIDLLNPGIGAAYHQWRYGSSVPYEQAPFWMDGYNISRLADGSLGFNGLVAYEPEWATQVALSTEQVPIPSRYLEELKAVETFLQTFTLTPDLKVHPPKSLYVRQTLQLQARQNLTGFDLLSGGKAEATSIGSFSYWIDLRGLHPWLAYPDYHPLPKPVFNTSLAPNFPKANPAWSNLAFLGRAAGYSPLSQGACRIVQHNALIAEGLAIALTTAYSSKQHPLEVEPQLIRAEMQRNAEALGLTLPQCSGSSTLESKPGLAESWLLQGDRAIAAKLQNLGYGQNLGSPVWKAPLLSSA